MSKRYNIYINIKEECSTCGHKHTHKAYLEIATGVLRVNGYTMVLHMYRPEYYKDIETMKEWTKKGEIDDEYNNSYTHEEFWKLVDNSLVDFIK